MTWANESFLSKNDIGLYFSKVTICHLTWSFATVRITMATKGFCQAINVAMFLKDMVCNKKSSIFSKPYLLSSAHLH